MSQGIPLAEKLRPQTLSQFVGQAHLVGEGKPLSRAIEQQRIPSMILWGPPGVGKTTLARLMAAATESDFHALSAVSAGKADLRRIVQQSQTLSSRQASLFDEPVTHSGSPVLFLDEIHRFNKAQQDFLLPYVEDGTLTLIGATTENPSFEVISALLSRLQVFVLNPLSPVELHQIISAGVEQLEVDLTDEAGDFLAMYANGDARAALNLLDNAAQLYGGPDSVLTLTDLKSTLQSSQLRYDKTGEEHYNTISAFIKSMRASNPDAALYYLARMIHGGEDPKFIARRMVIFASEDVGMADPQALVLANAVFRAVETVGLPEAQINLAHGVVYLATASKSRASYDAYFRALEDVETYSNLPVPMHLRNAPTDLMKDLGYGRRTHDSDLPEALSERRYYHADAHADTEES